MPRPGLVWRHVIVNTLCSWLHGDSRGFRSRDHEVHSSGDYKNPPPPDEHERLRQWMKKRARKGVRIRRDLRPVIGRVFRDHPKAQGHRVLCVAVGKVHVHALVELPDAIRQIRAVVGNAKRVSSRAVKNELPGNLWAAGGEFKRVKDRSHAFNVHNYIVYDQGLDAWTWSYRDATRDGQFKRTRPEHLKKRSTSRRARA